MKRANRACEEMKVYNKEDYLYVKMLKEKVISEEGRKLMLRHNRKLAALARTSLNQPRSHSSGKDSTGRDRITCIDTELTKGEMGLLSLGPKFVETKGRLSEKELRDLESQIETTTRKLRQEILRSQEKDKHDCSNDTESVTSPVKSSLLNEPKIRRIAVTQHTQAKQPPKAEAADERKITILKEKVLKAYKAYNPKIRNVSKEEIMAFKTLKEKDVIIKCSGKSKSLVAMNTETYLQKMSAILSDEENYEFSDMTAVNLEKRVEKELRQVKTLKNLPPDIYRGLFSKDSQLPEMYGLPKVHKPGAPLRPVVAAFDGPMSPVSILLERVLGQLLHFVPAHIRNTYKTCQHLKDVFPDLKVPENTILVTMDVVALYPSIPIDDGVAPVRNKLETHETDIDLLGLSIGDIERLLKLILNNNFFQFNGKVYRQRQGIAMGNHLAPPLAIIFMDDLEQKMIQSAEKRPEFFDRYVDDCIFAWKHGKEELVRFIAHCNDQHTNIGFTWEMTENGSPISFMDMSIRINGDNVIEHELYQKPSHSGVSLNYLSAIPMSTKIGVAVQQFRRAEMLSSDFSKKMESFRKVEKLLKDNDYPEVAIQQAMERSDKPPRQKDQQFAEKTGVTLRLPFLSEQLYGEVKKAINKLDLPIPVRVVHTRSGNIKDRLVRSAFVPRSCQTHQRYLEQQEAEGRPRGRPRDDCLSCQAGLQGTKCESKGVVYSLECRLCGSEYVGETKRTARARIAEHHAHARNATKYTAWGDHMTEYHPMEIVQKAPVFHNASVIATVNGEITRKVREAIEIRDRKPLINKSKGWQLI